MFREQGAKENMWSCDRGKFAAVDVTANVFGRTTYTGLLVGLLSWWSRRTGVRSLSDLNTLQFVVGKRRLYCYLSSHIIAIHGISARIAVVLNILVLTTVELIEVWVTYSKITLTTLDRDNKVPHDYVLGRRGVGWSTYFHMKYAEDVRTEQENWTAMSLVQESRLRSRCLPLDAKLLSFRAFMLIVYLYTN
jgi:hypothetical protein